MRMLAIFVLAAAGIGVAITYCDPVRDRAEEVLLLEQQEFALTTRKPKASKKPIKSDTQKAADGQKSDGARKAILVE